jgi:aquaporin Z
MNARALTAEVLGTFTLVLAICGTVMFAAPSGGGLLAVSLAAGIAVVSMAYAVGPLSGGHFNPAVSLGLVVGGRMPAAHAVPYILAQVFGAVAAAAVLFVLVAGAPAGPGVPRFNTFTQVSNHFGGPGQFSLLAAVVIEVVLTALFLTIIMGATSTRAHAHFAPIAIGLALTLFHLIAIPVTNASLNPARSTAAALFAGGKPLMDLWLFWVAPIAGGMLGGAVSRWLLAE